MKTIFLICLFVCLLVCSFYPPENVITLFINKQFFYCTGKRPVNFAFGLSFSVILGLLSVNGRR